MNFDTAIDPNQLEFRDAIARWVKEVGDKAESQGLEVKSTLGFNAGGERNQSFVKIIKFILGAANRDELKASRDFNGYGVMLIGISKGEVHGVENVPEQHPFEDFAKAYFGTAIPSYKLVLHTFEGKTLLFVLVDPPINGQKIYICSKNYQAQEKGADRLTDGAVYYRDSTQTKIADSVQLRDIINRLLGGNSSVELSISPHITNYCISNKKLKELFAEPAAKAAQEAQAELIEKEQENNAPNWTFPNPANPAKAKLKAAQNYENRIEECIQKVLEITLPRTLFSITNTGTKPLKNPTLEFTFPTKLRVIRLDDPSEVETVDVIPFLPAAEYPYSIVMPNWSELNSSFSISDDPARYNVLIWEPGPINPGQTVASHNELINILLEHAEEDVTIIWRITDNSLPQPLTGSISQKTLIVKNPLKLYERVSKRKRLGE
jgi:hypothetical protein